MVCIALQLLLAPVMAPIAHVPTPAEELVAVIGNDAKTQLTGIRRIVLTQGSGTVEMRFSWEQNGRGASRSEMVSPLRYKGSLVIDDGKMHVRFDPRTNRFQVQPSSTNTLRGIADKRRLSLVQMNYVVTKGKPAKVAGRSASVLVAKPRRGGSLTRTYWVDEKKNVILKMQVDSTKGERLMSAELLSPDFARPVPAQSFRMNVPGLDLSKLPPSRMFTSLSDLQRSVGFDILAPDKLPMGMGFLCGESITAGGRQAAALRFSDGLAFVSVYQVPSDGVVVSYAACSGQERSAVFGRRGSKYTIVGDIGESGMKQFVTAFEQADQARRELWSAQLAKTMGVDKASVHALLDHVIDVDEAAFMMAVMKASRLSMEELRTWRTSGLTWQQIIQKSKADPVRVEQAVRMVSLEKD